MIAPDYDPVRTANTILIRKMALLLKEKEPLTVVTMTPEGDSGQKGAVQ